MKKTTTSAPLKILIVRFSSIGDIVLTSPVIRCLKQQLNANIHFVTKAAFADLVEANPYIDKLHLVQKSLDEVIPALRKERFDYVIDLHNNLRSWRLRLAIRTTAFGFKKLNFQKWLLVQFKVNRLPAVHIIERYMAATAPLGIRNDGAGLDYFLPTAEEVYVSQTGPALQISAVPTAAIPPPFIALAIGGAHATKRLPVNKLITICRKLPLPVILLGGPADESSGAQIAEAVGSKVHNGCGELSLHQSASIIRQASVIISHDTGMMHIAAAFGKPVVSVWGNTIPEFGMYPYYPAGIDLNTTIEVAGLACRPCSKIGFARCPQGHFRCMRDVDENQVVAACMI